MSSTYAGPDGAGRKTAVFLSFVEDMPKRYQKRAIFKTE
jgi:hypothetical protein